MEPPTKRHRQEVTPEATFRNLTTETPGLATGVHKEPKHGIDTLKRLQSVERGLCSQTLNTPVQPVPLADDSKRSPLAPIHESQHDSLGLQISVQLQRAILPVVKANNKQLSQTIFTLTKRGPEAPEAASASFSLPAPDAPEQQPSSSECEFLISYSQNYSRIPSLGPDWERVPTEEDPSEGAGPLSWESDTLHFSTRSGSTEGGNHQTTPELSAQPGEGTPQTRKFFPLFRPKSEWKMIHIIRHGESEYNAATNSKDFGFADPQIFDPKLTTKGRRQASLLRSQLDSMKISKDALWVVSPLTRAIETMVLACPLVGRIGASEKPLNVIVHKDISEQCQTTGDIGLPASVIKSKFPQFNEALAKVPERWWFRPDANDAEQKRFFKPESTKQMRVRVGEFRKWVQNRPEKVIVAFGHNCLFKELTNGQKSLRNCEIHSMAI